MVTSNQLENMLFWHSLSFLHSFLSLWSGHSNIWFHTQQLNPISFHQPLLSRSTSSSLSKCAYSLALPHSPFFTVTWRSFYFFKSNNINQSSSHDTQYSWLSEYQVLFSQCSLAFLIFFFLQSHHSYTQYLHNVSFFMSSG